jgi:hypothetical protein
MLVDSQQKEAQMRHLLTTLIAAAGLAAAAQSAFAAPVVFKGTAIVESLSAQCSASSPQQPQIYSANIGQGLHLEYKPFGLGSNGSSAVLSVQGETDVSSWIECHEFEVAITTGQQGIGDATRIALTEKPPVQTYTVRMRLLSQTPATLSNATKFVILRGRITGVGNIPGCTLTFRAALVR